MATPKTKDQAIQTEPQTKDYISTKQLAYFQLESTLFPKILQKSHTIFILFILTLFIIYNGIQTIDNETLQNSQIISESLENIENNPLIQQSKQWLDQFIKNSKKGLMFASISIIVYGMLFFRDSVFQRPHPSFWRILNAMSIIYLIILNFLFFQNKQDLQFFLKVFFDHRLGSGLKEIDEATLDQCTLYTPHNYSIGLNNFYQKIDIFIIAHLFGWYGKMIIFRDLKMVLFQSVFFEFIEVSLRAWLPNFNECWWDSYILDIFGCNLLGIIAGYYTIKIFNMKEYSWFKQKINKKQSLTNQIINFFTLDQLNFYNWKMFQSTWRFYTVLWYIIFVFGVDLSNFFNKFILNIPSNHFLLTWRICYWGWVSVICTREYYEYIEDPYHQRVGAHCWIAHLILMMEWLLFFKFYRNEFSHILIPAYIQNIWIIILLCIIIITIRLVINDFTSKQNTHTKLSNILK